MGDGIELSKEQVLLYEIREVRATLTNRFDWQTELQGDLPGLAETLRDYVDDMAKNPRSVASFGANIHYILGVLHSALDDSMKPKPKSEVDKRIENLEKELEELKKARDEEVGNE